MPRSAAEELRIEARRLKVAELYLHGTRCLSQIARELGVDKAQISRDFKQIRKLWRERYLEDFDSAKHEELAKVAEIEQKAWAAWERSCKDGETMEVTGTSQGGKGKPDKVKKRTKRQVGDPRYLAILLKCAEQRRAILGIDAPKKLDHTTGGQPFYKAYLFDPDQPSQSENEPPA
jgi:transposase-like protein